jgi:hypothetical protein
MSVTERQNTEIYPMVLPMFFAKICANKRFPAKTDVIVRYFLFIPDFRYFLQAECKFTV